VAARSLSISRAYLHRLLRLAEADSEAAFAEQPQRNSVKPDGTTGLAELAGLRS